MENKIFVSWSGDSRIPEALKGALAAAFGDDFSIFVSSVSIPIGEEWFPRIRSILSESAFTIVCITKDNLFKPWLYFEAGASVFHNACEDKPLMVILFDVELPEKSPLQHYNNVKWSKSGYKKLLNDINSIRDKDKQLTTRQVNAIAEGSYQQTNRKIDSVIREIRSRHSSNIIKTYPPEITAFETDYVYLACPMASLDDHEYEEVQRMTAQVQMAISANCRIPKKKIYAPAVGIPEKTEFDGEVKALGENIKNLKKAEYYVCLYTDNVPSSVIAEIGYCVALQKRVVLFVKEDIELPYMLHAFEISLPFVTVHKYKNTNEIIKMIEKNQKNLLRGY